MKDNRFDIMKTDLGQRIREFEREDRLYAKYSKGKHPIHYASGNNDSEYGDSYNPERTGNFIECATLRVSYLKSEVTCKHCLRLI